MNDHWLRCHQPNPDARLRLVCFPHAGGAASAYRLWPRSLSPDVEVNAVELPGRGTRFGEPTAVSLASLVADISEALLRTLDGPFVFFGHSMGALLAFEVARRLVRRSGQRPLRLLVSAAPAPGSRRRGRRLGDRSNVDLKQKLRDLNGTPDVVLGNRELMELMLPVLRADLTLLEAHTHVDGPPMDIPISAFGGLNDRAVECQRIEGWRRWTREMFSLCLLPGGHFYLHESPDSFLRELGRELRQALRDHDAWEAHEDGPAGGLRQAV